MAGCGDSDKNSGSGTSPLSPPTVISVLPANGSCPNAPVSVTFSKAMNPATINATTFTVTPGITGTIAGDTTNTTFTFTPGTSTPLVAGTTYTVTITTGAVSQFGIALAANSVSTFTPVACPTPAVVSVLPKPAPAAGPCPGALISATFNIPMNPATINASTFTVAPGVTATSITPDATNTTFTFAPSSPLTLGTTYTATINTGAQSSQGVALANNFQWMFTPMACPGTITLGAALCGFGVLGGQGVSNTGIGTNVTGDVGVSPLTAIVGFPPGTLTGMKHSADAAAAAAQAALVIAYGKAAGAASPPGNALPPNIGGSTLFPGVYHTMAQPSLFITGNLTLDGNGDPNAVFIFQIGTTLITAAGSVNLQNGAQAKNVFWQVGSSATLGAGTTMSGNVMTLASITMNTGATLNGRALAQAAGAVTLDNNPINVPPCP